MTDRRRFLRAAAAVTGAAVAGCSGGSGDETSADGGGGSDGDGAAPAGDARTTARSGSGATSAAEEVTFPDVGTGAPTYREWLPAEGDARLAGWGAQNLARLRSRRDALPASDYESATGYVTVGDYFGVDFGDLDGFVNGLSGPGTIYPGEFDRSAVDAALTDSGYEQFDTRGNAAFYREPDAGEPARFAVGDGGVIEDPYGTAEAFRERAVALFETAAGERQRRHEVDERFRRYSEAVGWPLATTQLVSPGNMLNIGAGGIQIPDAVRETVALGRTDHVVDGATVSRTWLWTVADGDLTPADVRSTLADGDYSALPADTTVAVRRDGRVVEVAVVRPVETAGGGTDPPQVTLDAAVSDGSLTLASRAGDTLSLDRFTVRVGTDTYGVEGTLAPGESVAVDGVPTDSASTIRVIYESPNGGSSVTVARVEGG